jgi:hypothetical protein
MDRDPDVDDLKRLHSLNGGLSWCLEYIVDVVVMNDTETLVKLIREVREGIDHKQAAKYADVILADFIRKCVIDGLREVEAPMQNAYKQFVGAHQKWEVTRSATEKATHAWEVSAEDFLSKLKVMGQWAKSAALERIRRLWRFEPNPFAYMDVVGTSSMLRTPGDFEKYHESFFSEINFIREISEYEVTKGRLERPVGMSDFESAFEAFKVTLDRAKELKKTEVKAEKELNAAWSNYRKERQKAIAVLLPLSEAGRLALFELLAPARNHQ